MNIPDYQTLMLPLLKLVYKHGSINRKESIQNIIKEFNLSEAQQKALLPSGKQTIIQSRVGWAWTYLKKAGLLESTRRGLVEITERGVEVLSENPSIISLQFLKRFPEFLDFINATQRKDEGEIFVDHDKETPEESLEDGYFQLKKQVLNETISKIKLCSPQFFEGLVVDVLVKMGYGGSRKDAGRAIGQSGDEGIDGIINEDRLGLDVIYLQAKRWEANVSRPEIQKFAGALQGKRAKKGIFITTSDFSSEAREYVKNVDTKIILINGQQLVELMWEYNVGLNVVAVYEMKKLDSDYFLCE